MQKGTFTYAGIGLTGVLLLAIFLAAAPDTDVVRDEARTAPAVTESYIVQASSADEAARWVARAGGAVTASLPIINGVGATLDEDQVAWLQANAERLRITPDATLEVSGTAAETGYPALTGAAQLHYQGVTGDGITVAVLDTGLWGSMSLQRDTGGAPRVVAQYDATLNIKFPFDDDDDDEDDDEDDDFEPRDLPFGDCIDACDDGTSLDDWNGHGTHVTSIIASSGRTADGAYQGVAPDVDIVAVRAFGPDGSGTYIDVIKALGWIVANRHRYDIRVLNLSFGAPTASHYWDDPVNQAVMMAWKSGIVVVTAAGNEGPGPMTVGVPGNLPYVITIGAMTDNYTPDDRSDDRLARFSATGPTVEGFVKPELLAPGGHMLGQMPPYAWLPLQYPEYVVPVGNYFTMSGTSQAAAVVSGIVALMLEDDPSLAPDDIKCRLMASARAAVRDDGQAAYSVFQQGAGMVDAVAAVADRSIGCANRGLNIRRDLWRIEHYAGPAGLDENGTYYLVDDLGNPLAGPYYQWAQGALWPKGALWTKGALWNQGALWTKGVATTDAAALNPDTLLSQGALWPKGSLWPKGLTRPASTYVWVEEE